MCIDKGVELGFQPIETRAHFDADALELVADFTDDALPLPTHLMKQQAPMVGEPLAHPGVDFIEALVDARGEIVNRWS